MNFVTLFDTNYIDRGKVLYDSLCEHVLNFNLFVVCLDNSTSEILINSKLPNLIIIRLEELEHRYAELKIAKSNRTLVEYYFTLSPFCPKYCLEKFGLSNICSLDADIKFYSTPIQYFNQLEEYSIIVTPHKFSAYNQDKIKYGIYNVSFQIFKNDAIGKLCLKKWSEDCIYWCKDYLDEENNRFADQLYLNNWLEKYRGSIYVINDEVGGIAPWNINNYNLSLKRGRFYSADMELIFYHFHDFRIIQKNYIFHSFQNYGVQCTQGVIALYKDYFRKLSNVKLKSLPSNNIRFKTESLYKRVKRGEFFFLNVNYLGFWHMDDSMSKIKLRKLMLRKWRN
jgi:hypothetical protein